MPQHCHPCILFQLVNDNLYFVSDDIDIALQDSRHLFDSISRDRIAIPINRTLGHNDDVQSLRKEKVNKIRSSCGESTCPVFRSPPSLAHNISGQLDSGGH